MKALIPRLVRGFLLVAGILVVTDARNVVTVLDGFIMFAGAAMIVVSQTIE